jgi:hypothetical protein
LNLSILYAFSPVVSPNDNRGNKIAFPVLTKIRIKQLKAFFKKQLHHETPSHPRQ